MSLKKLKQQIVEYADNDNEYGWLTVEHNNKTYQLPKRALIHYVFGKMRLMDDIIPPYKAFSRSGLKLAMDNPFHSDVLIGAGFSLKLTYRHNKQGQELHEVLFRAEEMIETEFKKQMRFDFTILANGRKKKETYFRCRVYDHEPLKKGVWSSNNIACQKKPKEYESLRCIVIPRASVEYDIAAKKADVIITEVGGPLAHLAIISREKGKLLIRIPDACKKFPPFTKFKIDLDDLTITPA